MPHNILVADDDPHIREIICFALEKAGMKTPAVANGAAALQAVERGAPDLIVLDIGMPEMDGLEVCRRLRQKSDVPVLFLSARDEEIDRILGLEMGADDYVTKPFSPRELVARVNAVLRRVRWVRLRPFVCAACRAGRGQRGSRVAVRPGRPSTARDACSRGAAHVGDGNPVVERLGRDVPWRGGRRVHRCRLRWRHSVPYQRGLVRDLGRTRVRDQRSLSD